VRVKYDEREELYVPEDRYRVRGYQPSFEKLPWKDEAGEAANDTWPLSRTSATGCYRTLRLGTSLIPSFAVLQV
jgi:hypothetical protein